MYSRTCVTTCALGQHVFAYTDSGVVRIFAIGISHIIAADNSTTSCYHLQVLERVLRRVHWVSTCSLTSTQVLSEHVPLESDISLLQTTVQQDAIICKSWPNKTTTKLVYTVLQPVNQSHNLFPTIRRCNNPERKIQHTTLPRLFEHSLRPRQLEAHQNLHLSRSKHSAGPPCNTCVYKGMSNM